MPGKQLDLLDAQTLGGAKQNFVPAIPAIEGLRYFGQFLSTEEQDWILNAIDKAEWMDDLERRVQHYGWRYDYRSRNVSRDMRIGEFPTWLRHLGEKLCEAQLFRQVPDQAIVNQYLPGQGIAMHIDRQCFGPVVATVSLGDAWRMELRPIHASRNETKQILLDVGSVLALSGEARYSWMHGIASRKKEREGGGWRPRERRVSVTFRTVQLDG